MNQVKKMNGHQAVTVLALATVVYSSFCHPVFGEEKEQKVFRPGQSIVIKLARTETPAKVIRLVVRNIYEVEFEKDGDLVRQNYPVAYLHAKQQSPHTPSGTDHPSTPSGTVANASSDNASPQPEASKVGPSQVDTSYRMWADHTGKYQVKARFVSATNSKVTLRREDGKQIEIPITKLSQADQNLLANYPRGDEPDENPFDPTSATTTATVPSVSAGSNSQPSMDTAKAEGQDDATPTDGNKRRIADWSDVVEIAVGGDLPAWSPRIDSAEVAAISAKPVFIKDHENPKFSIQTLHFIKDLPQALVAYGWEQPRDTEPWRFVFVDVKRGKTVRQLEVDAQQRPVAVSPDGKFVVSQSPDKDHQFPELLTLARVEGKRWEPVFRFIPYENVQQHKRETIWARWVGPSQLVTVSKDQRLVLWDLLQIKVIYSLRLVDNALPALSPNGKYLSAITSAGIEVYETATGELLGRLSDEVGYWPVVEFSPDGKRLAAVESDRFRIWDMESGELTLDILVPIIGQGARIRWFDQQYVGIQGNGLLLIDATRRIVLWDYRLSGSDVDNTKEWQGQFWSIGRDRRGSDVLFPTRIPDEHALRTAKSLRPDDTQVVKPGLSVGLEMNIKDASAKLEQIRSSLIDRLEENGLTVGSGSALKLVATTRTGERRSTEYRVVGQAPAAVSYTEQVSSLAFVSGGRTVWKAERVSGAPYFVRPQAGQSAQQYVNENTKPNLDCFTTARIPTHIAKPLPEGQRAYGRSYLQSDGTIRVMKTR